MRSKSVVFEPETSRKFAICESTFEQKTVESVDSEDAAVDAGASVLLEQIQPEADDDEEFLSASEASPIVIDRRQHDRKTLRPPQQYAEMNIAELEPRSYQEAMRSVDRESWMSAVEDELQSLAENSM